jgi:linker histone H1 and H5 family
MEKQAKKYKTHPPFSIMIAKAILAENNPNGSTRYYIKKYLEANYNISPTFYFTNVSIGKLLDNGTLIRDENYSEHFHVSDELRKKFENSDIKKQKIKKVEKEKIINEEFANAGKKWTPEQDKFLNSQIPTFYDGQTDFDEIIKELSQICQRTPSAIKYRIVLLTCKHFIDVYDPRQEFESQYLCTFSPILEILKDVDIERFNHREYIMEGTKNIKITPTMSTTPNIDTTDMGIQNSILL